jgi:hypothetical protein
MVGDRRVAVHMFAYACRQLYWIATLDISPFASIFAVSGGTRPLCPLLTPDETHEGAATLLEALDSGITLFDTCPQRTPGNHCAAMGSRRRSSTTHCPGDTTLAAWTVISRRGCPARPGKTSDDLKIQAAAPLGGCPVSSKLRHPTGVDPWCLNVSRRRMTGSSH